MFGGKTKHKPYLPPIFFLTLRDGPWEIHIHGPHGSAGCKHIHITRNGLKGEYSWSVNGTQHDKHKFPSNEKWIKRAKTIAAEHLNVPASTLQFLTSATISTQHALIEIIWNKSLYALVASGKGTSFVVLSSQDGSANFMIINKRETQQSALPHGFVGHGKTEGEP
jgi:hypothetical protein